MANVGVIDPTILSSEAGAYVSDGITVSTLGLGLDYNEDLLTQMSGFGGGDYHFVNHSGMLGEMFTDQMETLSAVVGREVTVNITLPENVSLLEVYGYEASINKDGYSVLIGDMHAGQTRKVVARVHIEDNTLGAMDIADVDVAYSSADSLYEHAHNSTVTAEITKNETTVLSSINLEIGRTAARAAASRFLDDAARAWENGDTASQRSNLEEGQQLLQDLAIRYSAPELIEMAEEYAAHQAGFESTSPSSSDGLFRIKKAKEEARAQAL
jgi:Ca-activated chloride channel family protein